MKEEMSRNNKQTNQRQPQQEHSQSKASTEAKGQSGGSRSFLGIGYHGTTFVNDLSRLGERGAGQNTSQVGRGGGTSATQLAPSTKAMNEYMPYTGSSMANSDTSRPAGGPNLMVGGASSRRQQQQQRELQQQETTLEEEARRRNLKRQMSLYNTSSAPTALQQQLQQPCHSLSDLRDPALSNGDSGNINLDYANLGQPFRQISSSSYQGSTSHAPTPSGIRLTKHNLVFKTDSSSTHQTHGSTPRGPSAQLSSDDLDAIDSGEVGVHSGNCYFVKQTPV